MYTRSLDKYNKNCLKINHNCLIETFHYIGSPRPLPHIKSLANPPVTQYIKLKLMGYWAPKKVHHHPSKIHLDLLQTASSPYTLLRRCAGLIPGRTRRH